MAVTPSGAGQQQAAGLVEASKRPVSSRSGSRTRMSCAEAGGALEPVGADGGEALPAPPLRQPPRHGGAQAPRTGAPASPGRRPRPDRSPDGCVSAGCAAQLTPMPMATAKRRLAVALDQDAGELLAAEQQIVRPFHLQRGPELRRAFAHRVMQRQRGDEGQLRRQRRRRRLARAAAWRRDCPAATPRRCRGGRGRRSALRGDPQRPALAGARKRQRLGIGGAERLVSFVPGPRQARGFAVHLATHEHQKATSPPPSPRPRAAPDRRRTRG